MKMCASSSRYVAVRSWRVWYIAIIYLCSMFRSHRNLSIIFRFFIGL